MKKNRYFLIIIFIFCYPHFIFSQCLQNYNWTTWNSFTGNAASGTVIFNGNSIGVNMISNFSFSSTGNIFGYSAFSGFPSAPPNSTVPLTTWAAGVGGTTDMCFSQQVQNPVLLLASIGNPSTPVTLKFSRPYIVVYDGGGNTFVNDTTLTGLEGYAIIKFPGNFNCVTIYSTTPEYYTNITWGLNPPLFPVSLTQNFLNCDSSSFTAGGGVNYTWSGGLYPDKATNTFNRSGTYFLTVTDNNNCQVNTSVTVNNNDTSFFLFPSDSLSICESPQLIDAGYYGPDYSYLWSTGETTRTISVNTLGKIFVTVKSPMGCIRTDTLVVVSCPSISNIINIYTPVTSIASCNSITVVSSQGFQIDDKVLIIQMKGALANLTNTSSYGLVSNYNDAGNYEFATITAINGNSVTLRNRLLKSYDVSSQVQLISVPRYKNVRVLSNLTAEPWNGSTGGILVFEASDAIIMDGDIDLTGLGFRGGAVSNNYLSGCSSMDYYYTVADQSAYKGEGIVDFSNAHVAGRGAIGNGGGGGNHVNSGGGGGANFGKGGRGGDQWAGCPVIPIGGEPGNFVPYGLGANRIFLGGGGGGGHQNNGSSTAGTNGGGIVIIKASSIKGNDKSIRSNGLSQINLSNIDGSGGGGAGGTIVLDVNAITGNLNINLAGGNGGSLSSVNHGPGGGGGGGSLLLKSAALLAGVNMFAAGGLPGADAIGNIRNAGKGSEGGLVSGISIPENNDLSTPSLVSFLNNDSSICQGDTLDLIASVSPKGSYSYEWAVPAGAINPGNTQKIRASVPGTYIVTARNLSDILCNSDFEENFIIPSGAIQIKDQSAVSCWKTTATDGKLEFWGNGANNINAFSGNQFIELSANQPSVLFQDFIAQPGSIVNVSFAHRGRFGVDQMRVEVGPISGPFSDMGVFSDANSSWNYYSNILYSVPFGSGSAFRIRFIPVSASGGNLAFGNLLDAITVTTSTCALTPDTFVLKVRQPTLSDISMTVCDSLNWRGKTLLYTGIFRDTLLNAAGCDSIITLDLTVNAGSHNLISVQACDSFLWYGNIYSNSGKYLFNYSNNSGCNSTDTLDLLIRKSSLSINTVNSCDSFAWNDSIYRQSGTFFKTGLTNSSGCDSVARLNLTIGRDNSYQYSLSACNSYSLNGVTYTQSGIYTNIVLTNSSGCDSFVIINLTILKGPYLGPDIKVNICEGETANLCEYFNTENLTAGWTFNNILIQDPVNVSEPGRYVLSVTDNKGCSDTVNITLAVQPALNAYAGPDRYVKSNNPFYLSGSGGYNCFWMPADKLNNSNSCSPTAVISSNTEFVLVVYDEFGCFDTDTVLIRVIDGTGLFVPNAFTPNGDGINDDFGPITVGISQMRYFRIFNRFGELVFESLDPLKKWNGFYKGVLMGAANFVWVCEVLDENGKTSVLKGNVLLIR